MKVGFAKRDITPEVGVFLAGNGDYQSKRLHDPLYARAVVLTDGDHWVALVSCDLIGIDHESVSRVRELLREQGFTQTEAVLISCTHTHNGPHTRFLRRPPTHHEPDPAYMDQLHHAVADAIVEASRELRPATMKYARGLAYENFNRRLVTPDGTAHFYNPGTLRKRPELAELNGGVVDRELDVLQFLDPSGKPFLTLAHYAAHPLTIGIYEDVISTDYCGRFVGMLEEAYGVPAVFFQGACGDIHSKGLFEGFERCEEMAANLTAETRRILESEECGRAVPSLAWAQTVVRLPVDPARREQGGWNPEIFGENFIAEMTAVALGPVVMVSLPGELCCQPGLEIRWNSPFAQTWLLYLCNSHAAYLVPPRAYTEGGYEAGANCLRPEACPLMVRTAQDLCRRLA